jgi:hypothetical protein
MTKWQGDIMMMWKNGNLTKIQIDNKASWKNGQLAKRQVEKWGIDRLTSWQNGKWTKCQIFGAKKSVSILIERPDSLCREREGGGAMTFSKTTLIRKAFFKLMASRIYVNIDTSFY